jgi:hypothetical protein
MIEVGAELKRNTQILHQLDIQLGCGYKKGEAEGAIGEGKG